MSVEVENRKGKKGLFDLEDRVVVVTGGAGGLGKIFSEILAEFGAHIAICDIDGERALETARSIEKLGRRSLAIRTDVSHPNDVRNMVEETVKEFGTIDILINNAGITVKASRVADMAIEDWDRVMAVDLRGIFLCTRAVLPVMQQNGKGNIINIVSVYGVRPLLEMCQTNPNAHYAAAKAGAISLTKETALEYAREGIRVNCIAPGFHGGTNLAQWIKVDSEEERRQEFEKAIVRTTPMGRRGVPDELEGIVLYLASDASSFVTGQVFISDGGICV